MKHDNFNNCDFLRYSSVCARSLKLWTTYYGDRHDVEMKLATILMPSKLEKVYLFLLVLVAHSLCAKLRIRPATMPIPEYSFITAMS